MPRPTPVRLPPSKRLPATTIASLPYVEISLAQLAELVGGTILRDSGTSPQFTGFASCDEATPDDLTFYSSDKYLEAMRRTDAGAALVPKGFNLDDAAQIGALVGVDDPSAAFSVIVKKFGVATRTFRPGIHPTAFVDASAELAPGDVFVGPKAVISAGAKIGAGTSIGAGVVIGDDVTIGENCFIHPNASVLERCEVGNNVTLHAGCVIGSDGFGYEHDGTCYQKVDQVGIVQIDDDVEIGANSTIDRARFGRTWLKTGVKIDNLVQVAHNCVIGEHSALAAHVGISGSTRIGAHCIVAGQAGVAGHLKITDQVVVLGGAGVTKSITKAGRYLGYPAEPHRDRLKSQAFQRKLPKLFDRVKALEEIPDFSQVRNPGNDETPKDPSPKE